ncbi:helix-turn-helix domain-containing protein [Citrobacter youngae]|nr:helix-turn-helix domain-containing protein [Citrobacter youngae]
MSDSFWATKLMTPSPFTESIIAKLEPHCEIRNISPRKRLYPKSGGKYYCYLLLKGYVSYHRDKNDIAVLTASAPTLFGLNYIASENITTYIKTLPPAIIGVMPLEKAIEIIEEHHLWKAVAQHMMVLSNKLYIINEQMSAPTSYELIKFLLLQLMSENESYRKSITAVNYILGKTQLSRSGIMRILTNLKAGGYIEIHRGCLIRLNKLPAKF